MGVGAGGGDGGGGGDSFLELSHKHCEFTSFVHPEEDKWGKGGW